MFRTLKKTMEIEPIIRVRITWEDCLLYGFTGRIVAKDDFGNYKVKLDADNPWDRYRGVSVPPDIAEFKGYDLQLIEYI